jgi:MFS family permease
VTAALRAYLVSTALTLVPGGVQMVLFPWLVAVYLHESPTRVGIAQMAGQLPMLFLILWGGLIGDRIDQRRLLVGTNIAMVVPPLVMAGLVSADLIVYEVLLVWAMIGGVFGAFAQPARDALLSRVAGPDIQNVVTLTVGVQFGIQILGFALGSTADTVGPATLLVVQAVCLAGAAIATLRIPALPATPPGPRRSALTEIADGIALAWRSDTIRPALVLSFAVGVFFAGTYMVLLPLMIRDLYQGSAGGIALGFACNMLGTCTTILFLVRRGGIARPGRALMLGATTSLSILSLLFFELPIWTFYGVVYLWGLCGGISMTMSRAIVQEASPETHRARLMSVYSLGMMGGMPLGSILLGWAVGYFGARNAVLVPVFGMMFVLVVLGFGSRLWHVRRNVHPVGITPPVR